MNRFNTGNKALDIMLKFACSLIAAIMGAAFFGSLIWALWDFSPFSAYAEDESSSGDTIPDVELTLQQTLALFGTTLNGTYYDATNDVTRGITFHYWTDTQSIGYMEDGQTNLHCTWSGFQSGNSQAMALKTFASSKPYLVYYASPSDWGGGEFNTSRNRPNITLNCSVPLYGIDKLAMNIMYSSETGRSGTGYSDAQIFNNGVYVAGFEAQQMGALYSRYAILPMYAYYASQGAVDESTLAYCHMVPVGNTYENAIDFNSMTLNLYCCDDTESAGSVYVFIQCPTLHQESVLPPNPVTTTATTVTTTRGTTGTPAPAVSYVTGEPADLSNIESGIAEIIRQEQQQNWQLNWIGQNAQAAVYDLGLICEKLDKIYNLMVQQGDLPTTDVSEDFAAWFAGALQTHTTARIPDEAVDGLDFLSFLFSRLSGISWLVALGGLGLATGAASWIIFKGRGG